MKLGRGREGGGLTIAKGGKEEGESWDGRTDGRRKEGEEGRAAVLDG